MSDHNHISYIEFPTVRIDETKTFFSDVFGWSFIDYGEEYTSFSEAGVYGGFFAAGSQPRRSPEAALVILYSNDLESTQQAVEEAGCEISKKIFSFPGGRRFHFIEPGGNELGVWSE